MSKKKVEDTPRLRALLVAQSNAHHAVAEATRRQRAADDAVRAAKFSDEELWAIVDDPGDQSIRDVVVELIARAIGEAAENKGI